VPRPEDIVPFLGLINALREGDKRRAGMEALGEVIGAIIPPLRVIPGGKAATKAATKKIAKVVDVEGTANRLLKALTKKKPVGNFAISEGLFDLAPNAVLNKKTGKVVIAKSVDDLPADLIRRDLKFPKGTPLDPNARSFMDDILGLEDSPVADMFIPDDIDKLFTIGRVDKKTGQFFNKALEGKIFRRGKKPFEKFILEDNLRMAVAEDARNAAAGKVSENLAEEYIRGLPPKLRKLLLGK